MYARAVANLRTCAYTTCSVVGQLREREAVMVTGRTEGEAVNRGSTLWYRVDYQGRQVYVYGSLLADTLPTAVPPTPVPLPPPVIQPEIIPPPDPLPEIRINPDPAPPPESLGRPTARCRDGTYSYSAHRRGTCSHHGGVAQWYP
jgi:hypothetical protein